MYLGSKFLESRVLFYFIFLRVLIYFYKVPFCTFKKCYKEKELKSNSIKTTKYKQTKKLVTLYKRSPVLLSFFIGPIFFFFFLIGPIFFILNNCVFLYWTKFMLLTSDLIVGYLIFNNI